MVLLARDTGTAGTLVPLPGQINISNSRMDQTALVENVHLKFMHQTAVAVERNSNFADARDPSQRPEIRSPTQWEAFVPTQNIRGN